ncbi:hypothetical protein F8154_01745 [Alkaliphilus pronyensis]|uniref:Uncharacterized protein n=1 Tax=Alkaliphilus pronyensis TaxID=1482732 RepID=A0A6I0FHK9_9FIRM|nr:hypothetical protein [Alkaliphilus pronyensis]KAB3538637.1 hypothetical protein F8154_01745 [Alkaliphilus pronyensis]
MISEQPDSNTAYWYVVSNDSFILKQDIEELIDILSLETWKPTNEVVNDKLSRDIVINFNKFPEGKDEQNFDYNMGTFVTNQLTISKENQMVFDGHSNGDTVYSLDSDIINAIQLFIETKAISKEALVEKMN